MDDPALAVRARLIRIEDTRRTEPAVLDSALRSSDASLRRAAVLTAGRVGARAQSAKLRRLTSDADARVRGAAFYALGLLRDTTAVALASAGLRDVPEVAVEAAWLLGELGEPGRAGLLVAVVDSSLDARARAAGLLALARLRPPPVTPLLRLVSDADTAIAWRAAYALARARSAAAVRTMLAAASSSNADVRDYAARGLVRSLTGDSLGAIAIETLRQLVADPVPRVRVTAVRVLGGYGDAAAGAIRTAMRDRDAAVRFTAAAFAHLALDSTAAAWDDAWRFDTSFVVRRVLAESALRRSMLRGAWLPWHTDSRWQSRAAAATLDGLGNAAAAIERLDRALQDPDGRVRAAATEALAALVDSAGVSARTRQRLRGLLTDPDFVVRATALGALTNGASADDLAAALVSNAIARRDADLDARLAFWTLADSALRRAGASLPDSVERVLAAVPRPADPLERARAASIPRFAGWRDATSEPRPQEWYLARASEGLARRDPIARIETARGTMEVELFAADAPITVHNFASLARRGYFDGQSFHRVVPNFVIQAGDPRGDGNGGPGYAIRDELNPHRYRRGTLGMALSGPDTGGSQFFLTHAPQPHLDGGYTVFGQLLAGGDVLDRIIQGDRIVRITIR